MKLFQITKFKDPIIQNVPSSQKMLFTKMDFKSYERLKFLSHFIFLKSNHL